MTWTIAVPFRSRDEPLSAVGDAARRAFSTDEDRAVARQLVLGAAADGVATVGGLLDKLEKLGPAQRRSLLDLARVRAGLPDTGQVDARARADAASRAGRLRQAQESPWMLCPAPGCNAAPSDPSTGLPTSSPMNRWWCPEHEHLAADGDLEPRRPRLVIGPSGAFVDVAEQGATAARAAAEAESRQCQREAKLAERQAEAVEHADHERARARALDREIPDRMMPR